MGFKILEQFSSVTATILPSPTQSLSLTAGLFADLGSGTTGDTFTYSSAAAVQAAIDSSELTASAGAWGLEAFAQAKVPSEIKVVHVDIVGGDTYSQGITAAANNGAGIYFVNLDSEDGADFEGIEATIEAGRYLVIGQGSDADWLTAGAPAAWADLSDATRFAVAYHPTDTEHANGAWSGFLSALDPRVTGFTARVASQGVATYDSVDDSEYANLVNYNASTNPVVGNAIGLIRDGGSTRAFWPGQSVVGESIRILVVRDVLESDISDGIGDLLAQLVTAGDPWPFSDAGGALVTQIVEDKIAVLTETGHFVPGSGDFEVTLTPSTRTITVSGTVEFIDEADNITVDFNITRSA